MTGIVVLHGYTLCAHVAAMELIMDSSLKILILLLEFNQGVIIPSIREVHYRDLNNNDNCSSKCSSILN